MICRICGKTVEDGEKFCPKCGERCYSEKERQAMKEEQEARRIRSAKIKKTVALIVSGVLLLHILGAAQIWIIYQHLFVSKGTWKTDRFEMEDAGFGFDMPKNYQNLTNDAGSSFFSGFVYDAIIEMVAYSGSLTHLSVGHTTLPLRDEQGGPMTEEAIIELMTEGNTLQLGEYESVLLCGKEYLQGFFRMWDIDDNAYAKVAVRKEKNSYIVVIAIRVFAMSMEEEPASGWVDKVFSILKPLPLEETNESK